MVIITVLLALTISCSFNTEESDTKNPQSTKEKTVTAANSFTQIIQQMDSLSNINQTKLDTGKRMVKTMKEHLIETVELKNQAERLLKNELPNDKSVEQFDKKYGKQIEIFKQEIQKDIDEVGFVGEITDLSNYLLLVNLNKQRILEIKSKLEQTQTTQKVIVVPCANGYEYEMYNYDITSIIGKELQKSNAIELLPFPYKKLMNESYQGVFDKKYCNPIIESVDADFLILSRFVEDDLNKNHEPNKWGYETRIIDCKTKEQINSLSLNNAKDFNELKYHLKKNISTLVKDLNHFQK